MTIAELIEKLKDYPQTAIVAVNSVNSLEELTDIALCNVVPLQTEPNALATATSREIISGESAECLVLS